MSQVALNIQGAARQSTRAVVGFWKDFGNFINRGNVVDLAVGVVIGASFGSVVKSLVDDIIGPLIGLAIPFIVMKKGSNMPAGGYATRLLAKEDGAVTENWGNFIQTIISFLITSFCLFFFIRSLQVFQRKKKAEAKATTEQECSFCFKSIDIRATRCPHCTSAVKANDFQIHN